MKFNYKEMATSQLRSELQTIEQSYSKLYDMAEDHENRDAVFIKELTDLIIPISAVLEVFSRDEQIHPGYALEKLKRVNYLLTQHIEYWES